MNVRKIIVVSLLAVSLILLGCSSTSSSVDDASNQIPIADAGADQNITVGGDAVFDGSLSSDDGSIDAYVWDENGIELNSSMFFIKSDFDVGIHTITLTVTDNQGATDTDDLIITVHALDNYIPSATPQSIITDENSDINITLGGTDGDSDTLAFTIVTNPTNGTLSGTAPDVTYSPNTDYNGSDSFTFKVNDGIIDSAVATVEITINDVADAVAVTHNGVSYLTVISPYTSKIWLDRNLGATQVCTVFNDTACYGDYYQWGRNFDGHQIATSDATTTQATDINNAGADFIKSSLDWTTLDSDGVLRAGNWSKTDATSVCPTGFRVPTMIEIQAETTTIITNNTDAFNSFLKLPTGGARSYSGSIIDQASEGNIWSSQVNDTKSEYLNFDSYGAGKAYAYRGNGLNIRCIKSN